MSWVTLYVDDILLSDGDIKAFEGTKHKLVNELAMTDLGPVNAFVGVMAL